MLSEQSKRLRAFCIDHGRYYPRETFFNYVSRQSVQTAKAKAFSETYKELNLRFPEEVLSKYVATRGYGSGGYQDYWFAHVVDSNHIHLVYQNGQDKIFWKKFKPDGIISVIDVIKLLPDNKKEFLFYYLDLFDK